MIYYYSSYYYYNLNINCISHCTGEKKISVNKFKFNHYYHYHHHYYWFGMSLVSGRKNTFNHSDHWGFSSQYNWLGCALPVRSSTYVFYSASQKKRNWELSMFDHNLITIIINKWHIFVKLRFSSFVYCISYDAYFMHEWLKSLWRKDTKKSFGGRYLNFKEKSHF